MNAEKIHIRSKNKKDIHMNTDSMQNKTDNCSSMSNRMYIQGVLPRKCKEPCDCAILATVIHGIILAQGVVGARGGGQRRAAVVWWDRARRLLGWVARRRWWAVRRHVAVVV